MESKNEVNAALRLSLSSSYIRGVQSFFGEGQIQKNKQRPGPNTRGDILTHDYCVYF